MAETSPTPSADTQLFRHIFDASPIGIAVENLDGQPLFVNSAFCSMLGFSERELCSKHCVDFSPPEDAEKDWALFQQLKAGDIDHYQLEKRYFRRDGSIVWGLLSVSLLSGRASQLILAMVQNITEKKNAEEALRASEEHLQLAAEIGKMYAFTWDVTTDEVMRSPQYAAIFGVPDQSRFTRRQLSQRVHPADRARWLASPADLTPENPHLRTTCRVLRPDGSKVWLETNGRAFFDTNGNMLRMTGMVADVSERKLAEEALRASEERLRLAQQIGHIGSFERDIRTDVITWTAELEPLYGLPQESLIGTNTAFFESLIHPADRTRVTQLVDEALKTREPSEGEWRVIWPDGSIRWISGRWQVLVDESGKPLKVLGINADITDRKVTEQALRRSEEKFSKAFRQSPLALTLTSATDHRYIDVNKTFEDLTGWHREEVIGRTPFEIRIWAHESERFDMVRRLTNGDSVRDMELQYRRRDGSERVGLGSAELIEIGNELCVLSVIADITKSKQAEEALAGVTGKLIEAQEQERTRIARELHDDLNQRLALLSVELEAATKAPPQSAAAARLLISQIRERIDDISSDLQSMSHKLHSSQLEYLGIVAAARGLCRELTASQSVEITFYGDDIRTPVPHQVSLCLFRILQEALHNAVKHSKVRHIDVTLNCCDDHLQLTVSDRGTGFDPDAALKTGGLGLISMRERARLANGTISVDSKPAQGTTIHVRIPLKPKRDLQEAV